MLNHLLDEFNRPLKFFQKLGYTILLLVFGIVIAPFLAMGRMADHHPAVEWLIDIFLGSLIPFYLFLLVYIWWRPRWVAKLYRKFEDEIARIVHVVNIAVVLALVGGLLLLAVDAVWR